MVEIIPNNQKKSFSEHVLEGLNAATPGIREYLQQQNQQQMQQQQAKALQQAGIDPNLPPEFQKISFQNQLQGKNQIEKLNLENKDKANKLAGKNKENIAPFEGALSTINEMRNIGKRNKLGRGSSFRGMFGGETAKDIGEYEQLGKSLISFASTIPIRNQREFDVLSHDLFDSSIQDDRREGILDAMEKIIRDSMRQYQGNEGQMNNNQQENLSNQQQRSNTLEEIFQ